MDRQGGHVTYTREDDDGRLHITYRRPTGGSDTIVVEGADRLDTSFPDAARGCAIEIDEESDAVRIDDRFKLRRAPDCFER